MVILSMTKEEKLKRISDLLKDSMVKKWPNQNITQVNLTELKLSISFLLLKDKLRRVKSGKSWGQSGERQQHHLPHTGCVGPGALGAVWEPWRVHLFLLLDAFQAAWPGSWEQALEWGQGWSGICTPGLCDRPQALCCAWGHAGTRFPLLESGNFCPFQTDCGLCPR